jgi:hypothetical protein
MGNSPEITKATDTTRLEAATGKYFKLYDWAGNLRFFSLDIRISHFRFHNQSLDKLKMLFSILVVVQCDICTDSAIRTFCASIINKLNTCDLMGMIATTCPQ